MSGGDEQLRGRNFADAIDFSNIEFRVLCWHMMLLDGRELGRMFSDLPHSVWDETPWHPDAMLWTPDAYTSFMMPQLRANQPNRAGDGFTKAAIARAYANLQPESPIRIVGRPELVRQLQAAAAELRMPPEREKLYEPNLATGLLPSPAHLDELAETLHKPWLAYLARQLRTSEDRHKILEDAALAVAAELQMLRTQLRLTDGDIDKKLKDLRERLSAALAGEKPNADRGAPAGPGGSTHD